MTNSTDVQFRTCDGEFEVDAEGQETLDARGRAGASCEVWIAPRAGEPTRVRSFKVSRTVRDGRAGYLGVALQDSRRDARNDARTHDLVNAPARKPQSRGDGLEILHGYADASHPHGEALRPGAQRSCTEREKNAFGGTHPRENYLDQYRFYGSADAC